MSSAEIVSNDINTEPPTDVKDSNPEPMGVFWSTQESGKKPDRIGFVRDEVFLVKPVLTDGDTIIIEPKVDVYTTGNERVIKIFGTVVVQTAMREIQFNNLCEEEKDKLRYKVFLVPDDTEEKVLQIMFRAVLFDVTVECKGGDESIITYEKDIYPLIVHDFTEVTILKSAQDQK